MQNRTKLELIETMHRSHAEWDSLLAAVGEARMDDPGVEGVWAVRDIVAHLTAGERWTAVMVLAHGYGMMSRGVRATNLERYGRADVRPDIDTGTRSCPSGAEKLQQEGG